MISRARLAMTSLAFILLVVPAPPWIISTGNCSWCCPSNISWQACVMARYCSSVSSPRAKFASAAAILVIASPLINSGYSLRWNLLMEKFSIPLSVCTPYNASAGISRAPIRSLSVRVLPVNSVFISIRSFIMFILNACKMRMSFVYVTKI